MLKPAPYLVDDGFPTEPFLSASYPQAHQLATAYAAAAVILSDDGRFDREHTTFALRLGLLAANRLLDTTSRDRAHRDRDDLAHLVNGMALLHAHLAQTLQRLAELARIAAAGAMTDPAGRRAAESLEAASEGGEFVAGDLKRAYLALTPPRPAAGG
ncbi:hypothetical protein [Asanoa sp. NPDC050611]|uniref:hypothetical protein n=1 Tax=Asanoa sp. NPDC050611 TaxID=3157098 RepID=UPI0033D553D9